MGRVINPFRALTLGYKYHALHEIGKEQLESTLDAAALIEDGFELHGSRHRRFEFSNDILDDIHY